MSAADSKAVFFARLAELDLLSLQPKFEALGWKTHSIFAYVTSYQLGMVDVTPQIKVFEKLVDQDETYHPQLRQL